jgi:glycosyltransferase involved in cell wall biosynthesis
MVKSEQKVGIFLDSFLTASEAFIAAQAGSLQEFQPHFFAFKRVKSHLEGLDRFPVRYFRDDFSGRVGEAFIKLPRIAVPPLTGALREVDLIHAHFGKNGFIAAPLALRLKLPLITTFHGFDATYHGDPRTPGGINQTRFFAYGRKKMIRAGWAIAVSEFVRRRLLELGFRDDKVFRHYIGTDVEQFSRSPQVPRVPGRIVCVSRFVEYKGHRHIIRALSEVVASGRNIELCLVGSGPLRDEIEALARAVIPKVRIYDSLSQSQVRELVSSARVYVHGSITLTSGHSEALGVCNLEAQAAGTPVVAFNSGGVAEAMKSGETGFAVPERDASAMAGAIIKLLDDDVLWEKFSIAATRFIRENFDIRNQTRLLEEFYRRVLTESEKSRERG